MAGAKKRAVDLTEEPKRKAGQAGGSARASSLSSNRRREIAKATASAWWASNAAG